MSVVKSKTIYSAQNFIEHATGFTYLFTDDDDVESIHKLLRKHGRETHDSPIRDYAIDEIETIVRDQIPVVLVDTLRWNGENFISEMRWFEVPEGFVFGAMPEDE